jgi:hypothetical protein
MKTKIFFLVFIAVFGAGALKGQGGFLGMKNMVQADVLNSVVNKGIELEYTRIMTKGFGMSFTFKNFHKSFNTEYTSYNYYTGDVETFSAVDEIKLRTGSLGFIWQSQNLNVGLPAKMFSGIYLEYGKESGYIYYGAVQTANNLWIAAEGSPFFSIKYRFNYSIFFTRNIFTTIGFDYGLFFNRLNSFYGDLSNSVTTVNGSIQKDIPDRMQNTLPFTFGPYLNNLIDEEFNYVLLTPHIHIGYAF